MRQGARGKEQEAGSMRKEVNNKRHKREETRQEAYGKRKGVQAKTHEARSKKREPPSQ
jgi:hypothetical protein